MSFIFSEDEALKTFIQGFTVSDEKNVTRPVKVWFASPDIELRDQSFPSVTIELLDAVPANYRQHSGIITDSDRQGTIDPEPGLSYTYELPVAWDLTYQIVTYARHPRHDRQLIAHFLNAAFPNKRGYLPVKNDLGTETSYRHMFLEEFTKRDAIEEGRRLYRNVFTVSVTSEGTAPEMSATPDVSEVLINEITTHIPSGIQVV